MNSQGILLEAGTNEMELLIFRLANTRFGINVAKVREIIQRTETLRIPHSPAAVEGSFRLREDVLTLIDLGCHFGMRGEETGRGEGLIIIVEFNKLRCGILVDAVEVIHRLKWDEIEPPSPVLVNLAAPVTGVAHVGEGIVLIADFETVVAEILGHSSTEGAEESAVENKDLAEIRIFCADDSALLRTSLGRILKQNGFEQVRFFNDGQEAWEALEAGRNVDEGPCDLLLSDIEMPRMDGLHLTNRVRQDVKLKELPVVLFSSLINEENARKCKAVGASAQVSKPESKEMVAAIMRCLAEKGLIEPAPAPGA